MNRRQLKQIGRYLIAATIGGLTIPAFAYLFSSVAWGTVISLAVFELVVMSAIVVHCSIHMKKHAPTVLVAILGNALGLATGLSASVLTGLEPAAPSEAGVMIELWFFFAVGGSFWFLMIALATGYVCEQINEKRYSNRAACFACGYALLGLAGDPIRCPECGQVQDRELES